MYIISGCLLISRTDTKGKCADVLKLCSERITQNVVKSHLETCQYSPEELKKLTWNLYTPEETCRFQLKVQHHHTRSLLIVLADLSPC